jgi:hypothetical protein
LRPVLLAALLAFNLALSACFPFSGGEEHVDGPYYLFATDVAEDMALNYRTGPEGGVRRIPPTVYAVGWDERHIIAQRHPANDRSLTEYYILDRTTDSALAEPEESVVGPLTAEQFRDQREVLGVSPALGFTKRVSRFE